MIALAALDHVRVLDAQKTVLGSPPFRSANGSRYRRVGVAVCARLGGAGVGHIGWQSISRMEVGGFNSFSISLRKRLRNSAMRSKVVNLITYAS